MDCCCVTIINPLSPASPPYLVGDVIRGKGIGKGILPCLIVLEISCTSEVLSVTLITRNLEEAKILMDKLVQSSLGLKKMSKGSANNLLCHTFWNA